jgi:hypothetical protein
MGLTRNNSGTCSSNTIKVIFEEEKIAGNRKIN